MGLFGSDLTFPERARWCLMARMAEPPATVSVALWALNVGAPLRGLDDYVAMVEARLAAAAGQGARLLMLPEYACEPFLWFAPRPLTRPAELEWLAQQAAEVLPRLAERARRHDVALLAGAMPAWTGRAHRNRAHLLLPDGRVVVQDKLCLLPLERNPQGYLARARQTPVRIVTWRGLRIGIAVCLDVSCRRSRCSLPIATSTCCWCRR